MGRLLTIKEFAKAAGVTQQAIYKQFNRKLKKYSTVENGKKMLDIAALELFSIAEDSTKSCATLNQNSTSNSTVEQPKQREDQPPISGNSIETEELIKILKNELEQKNKLITDLTKRLEECNTILFQEQQLRALEHQQLLELQETVNTESSKVITKDKPLKRRILDFFKKI